MHGCRKLFRPSCNTNYFAVGFVVGFLLVFVVVVFVVREALNSGSHPAKLTLLLGIPIDRWIMTKRP